MNLSLQSGLKFVGLRIISTSLIISLLVFSIAFCLFLLQPIYLSIYDESLILTGALQWKEGLRTGVDFYTTYGPLQFIIVGQILEVFNNNIIATRALHSFILSIPIILLCSVLLNHCKGWRTQASLLFLILSIILLSVFSLPLYPNYTLILPATVIIWIHCDPKIFGLAKTTLLIFSLTCIILLRPGFGFVFLLSYLASTPIEQLHFARHRLFPNLISRLFITGMVIAITYVFDIFTEGSIRGVISLINDTHSKAYPTFRGLPFPTLTTVNLGLHNWVDIILTYFPIFAITIAGITYLLCYLGNSIASDNDRRLIYWLCFITATLYTMAFIRTDIAHLTPSLFFSIALFIVTISIYMRGLSQKESNTQSFFSIKTATRYVPVALIITYIFFSQLRAPFVSLCDFKQLTKSSQSCLLINEDQQATAKHLFKILKPGEKIFSANSRHDRIHVNNMSYYAITGNLPISYWAHMDPGVQTTLKVQEKIIKDIDSYIDTKGRAIIVIENYPLRWEPNKSQESSGVYLLDNYFSRCETKTQTRTTKIIACTKSNTITSLG